MGFRKDLGGVLLLLSLALPLAFAATSPSWGFEPRSDQFLRAIQVMPGAPMDDRSARTGFEKARADTVWYGGHDGNGYAVEGGVWDFEDGMGGPDWQGWYGVDETVTQSSTFYGKWVTTSSFNCPSNTPMIRGAGGGPNVGMLWFGQTARIGDQENPPDPPFNPDGADALCWVCDAGGDCSAPETRVGYANDVCDWIRSPQLAYAGGGVQIDFLYYMDCEGGVFDFIRVQVIPYDPTEQEPVEAGVVTIDPGPAIIGSPDDPVVGSEGVLASELPAGTTLIKAGFEFTADGGWSDEDAGGGICSTYGPFGVDSVTVRIGGTPVAFYDFESGDQGWTSGRCEGVGDFVDLHHLSEYTILDPCACDLEGWVLAMHDDNFEHPGDEDGSGTGQANAGVSPIVNRTAYPAPEWNDVFYRMDLYAWLPLENGVLYRPGAQYYPWTCTETGASGWSDREGQDVWFYVGTDPVCYEVFNNFVEDGIPGNADLYRVWVQLQSCCACFGIEDCTGITNETPLIDNMQVGLTVHPDAPVISIDTSGFVDAFATDGSLDPYSTARVDDAYVHAGVLPPFILSDSLAISGPVVMGDTDPWEAHLWFHIARKGPGQENLAYEDWRTRLLTLATFPGDVETDFVGVRMDSAQLNLNTAFPNKYCSFAHPDDPYYQGDPEADERSDLNEIIRDDMLTPGTRVEYFITGRFIGQTDMYFLPDTSDRPAFEIDILPGMRWSGEPENSDIVWPCVLHWDAFPRTQPIIESALNTYLPSVPGEGPNHDRYDERGYKFCGDALYRYGPGANNGGTLAQLLGYQAMILNTGSYRVGVMQEIDFIGVEDWLQTTACGGSSRRQGFVANGDEVAGIIEDQRPSLLPILGVGLDCSPYREPGCPLGTDADSSFCVKVIDSDGAVYPSRVEYYAFGNGCPNTYRYSVLLAEEGVGNRNWWDYDGTKGIVSFAQVVHDQSGGSGNFRSVIDGYSYDHITTTFNTETDECEADDAGRVEAAGSEIIAALEWIFDGQPPEFCNFMCDPIGVPETGDELEVKVNRLYQNEPNPFNPRTAIRFSVAARCPVELAIYDVSGRLVKKLVDKPMDPGLHTAVWDGTDTKGHRVGSGIYWSQLKVGDYVSSKKLVLLK